MTDWQVTARRAAAFGGIATALWLLGAVPGAAQGVACTLYSTPLAFGAVNALRPGIAVSTASVTVSCTAVSGTPAPVTVSVRILGGTQGANGLLLGGQNGPAIRLYGDSAGTVQLDDPAGIGAMTASGVASHLVPFQHVFTVYGRIPTGSSAKLRVGEYQDVLTVALSY